MYLLRCIPPPIGVTLNSAIMEPPRDHRRNGLSNVPLRTLVDRAKLEKVLSDLKAGRLTVGEALDHLRALPFEDLGFAKVDTHRPLRKGFPEAVYCPGKTDAQIVGILGKLAVDSNVVLATRATAKTFHEVRAALADKSVRYDDTARMILVGTPPKKRTGRVLVITAGTSGMPIAQEAAPPAG